MDPKRMLKSNWEDAQVRVKQAWGALTNDDIVKAQGNWDQSVSTIRAKIGKSVDTVEQKLDSIPDVIKSKGAPTQGDHEDKPAEQQRSSRSGPRSPGWWVGSTSCLPARDGVSGMTAGWPDQSGSAALHSRFGVPVPPRLSFGG